jgi:hypothetical protein
MNEHRILFWAFSNALNILQLKMGRAGCWCLTPIILATQKAEIRRIEVQSQPGK